MKIYLRIFGFLFLLSFRAVAQCTPDLSCLAPGASNGVCPSSGLDTGTVNVPYSEIVSVKVPEDGADFGQPLATIQHLDILSVDSLAPGLTYTCNPPSCHFPGNSNGCIRVHGTPTTVWDHKMTVHAMVYVKILFINTSQAHTLSGFYSVILNPTGVESSDLSGFELSQNSPNPFSDFTVITFNSSEETEMELKVTDMFGKEVYHVALNASQGMNAVELKAGLFAAGIYVYSLSNGRHVRMGRMAVTRN